LDIAICRQGDVQLHQEKYVKLVYLLIWGSTLVFGGSAVWALVWAIRNGQMSNLKAGAESIFDEEEPVGRPTDAFPGAHK
jgi:cbb3-type cytochrome oxidase maturation protein